MLFDRQWKRRPVEVAYERSKRDPNDSLFDGEQAKPPLVISLLRWSTDRQGWGRSERRQDAVIQRYADMKGWTIDERLRLAGIGASSGEQRSAKTPYGKFLAAVKEKLVPRGTVLLVEYEDRLSRQMSIRSTHQIEQLTRAGIEIHIVRDGTVYNRATMKIPDVVNKLQNRLTLGWDEIVTKTERARRDAGFCIKHNLPVPGHKVHSWLRVVGRDDEAIKAVKLQELEPDQWNPEHWGHHELIPHRAEIIAEMVRDNEFKSTLQIVKEQNEKGSYEKYWGRLGKWGIMTIDSILRSYAVWGYKQFYENETVEIETENGEIIDKAVGKN